MRTPRSDPRTLCSAAQRALRLDTDTRREGRGPPSRSTSSSARHSLLPGLPLDDRPHPSSFPCAISPLTIEPRVAGDRNVPAWPARARLERQFLHAGSGSHSSTRFSGERRVTVRLAASGPILETSSWRLGSSPGIGDPPHGGRRARLTGLPALGLPNAPVPFPGGTTAVGAGLPAL